MYNEPGPLIWASLHCKEQLAAVSSSAASNCTRPQRTGRKDNYIFNPDCLVCGKVGPIIVNENRRRVYQNTSIFDKDGCYNLVKAAEPQNDEALLTHIRVFDLFACKAKYHKFTTVVYISTVLCYTIDPKVMKKKKTTTKYKRNFP